jgi:hypothetical protein
MKCTCGEHGELKVFNTFQYYYCKKCKKEIEDKDFPEEKDEKDSKNLLDDFFLDFSTKPLTITLPTPSKGYNFEIYRNTKEFKTMIYDGKNWEIIERKQ